MFYTLWFVQGIDVRPPMLEGFNKPKYFFIESCMLPYAMLCYSMLCYAMLCYVIFLLCSMYLLHNPIPHFYMVAYPNLFNPTTSLLTATMIVYASGAGITAAAGTRLSLHLSIQITISMMMLMTLLEILTFTAFKFTML